MKIDERIVINRPTTIRHSSGYKQSVWTRRVVQQALWKMRCRILEETGEDIFHLFTMTDCIEFSLKGEIETLPDEKIKRRLNRDENAAYAFQRRRRDH